MNCRRRLILGIICTLLLAGFVRADMVSVYQPSAQRPQSQCTSGRAEVRQTNRFDLDEFPIVDFSLGSVYFPIEVGDDIGQSARVPLTIDLTVRPGSVNLCLYALMSLALYSAPHWLKRLHLGHLPEWYHDGGPFQIGHSFAATPKSLCTLHVCCLLPPDDTVEEFLPQYRLRSIISCWRTSQFTPEAIVSRGPPLSIYKG